MSQERLISAVVSLAAKMKLLYVNFTAKRSDEKVDWLTINNPGAAAPWYFGLHVFELEFPRGINFSEIIVVGANNVLIFISLLILTSYNDIYSKKIQKQNSLKQVK